MFPSCSFCEYTSLPLPQRLISHHTALSSIVASLFAMLGLTGGAAPERIARHLHRAVVAVLRPAESAVRRLIVVLAKGMKAKARDPRPLPAEFPRGDKSQPSRSFQLFDVRPRLFLQPPPRRSAHPQPRITFFGDGEVRRLLHAPEPKAAGDGLADAANLVRRLQAVKAALDNLPRQAQRLVRALARRAKIPCLKFQGPLRRGRAPGWRQRPLSEIDGILHQCDWLAREALPDTS
jgi:hypothetical protein